MPSCLCSSDRTWLYYLLLRHWKRHFVAWVSKCDNEKPQVLQKRVLDLPILMIRKSIRKNCTRVMFRRKETTKIDIFKCRRQYNTLQYTDLNRLPCRSKPHLVGRLPAEDAQIRQVAVLPSPLPPATNHDILIIKYKRNKKLSNSASILVINMTRFLQEEENKRHSN